MSDKLQQHLPEYNKWQALTLTSLLNMTSGLPNYSNSATMNIAFANDPTHVWSSRDLIAIAYPPDNFAPALKTGYDYTNTGYILATLIIEKLTHRSFNVEIEERTFKPAGLQNTFYPVPVVTAALNTRLAHGYGFNPYDNPELVGKDMSHANLSWAAAAGGIVANAEDVVRWTKALFVDDVILDADQKKQLEALVSNTTGKPIRETSAGEPRGFGLGVAEMYEKDVGRFWFYEGETIGFRALFMYVPNTGIIISCLVNSAVNHENDHAGKLMNEIYTIVKGK